MLSNRPYKTDPTGNKQIHSYQQMLEVLNHILTTAPHWTSAAEKVGMVGVPMNAVFDWPMGTPRSARLFESTCRLLTTPVVTRHFLILRSMR